MNECFDPRKHYADLVRNGWSLSQCGDLLDEETFVAAWSDGDTVDMFRIRPDGTAVWYFSVRIGWTGAKSAPEMEDEE